MKITSLSNPKFKVLKNILFESRKRKEANCFLVEGKREIQMALSGGFVPLELFFCEMRQENQEFFEIFPKSSQLSFELFSKLLCRENKSNLLALFEKKELSISQIKLSKCPCIWIIEKIEKPGNLGAILRTADALGIDAVGICEGKIDFFHPFVIRNSLGAIFTTQVFSASSQTIYNWLSLNKIKLFASALRENSKNLYEVDFRENCALLIGSEDRGLLDFWLERADLLIKIPMFGKVNSLNVSAATAIMGAEIIRQRRISNSF